jgi:hypothetical protein
MSRIMVFICVSIGSFVSTYFGGVDAIAIGMVVGCGTGLFSHYGLGNDNGHAS